MKKIILAVSLMVLVGGLSACATPGGDDEIETSNEEILGNADSDSDVNTASSDESDDSGDDFGDDEEVENDIAANDEMTTDNNQQDQDAFSDFEDDSSQEKAQAQSDTTAPVQKATENNQGEPVSITGIDYIANQSGGILQISMTGKPGYTSRNNADSNQFVVEIEQATLPDSLKRPFIMKEFESAFGAVNAYQNPGSSTARIVVQMRGAGEPVLQVEGNKMILLPPAGMKITEVAPAKEAWEASYDTVAASKDEKVLGARTLDEFLAGNVKFYGSAINLETTDADVRDVIKFISEDKGVNLVLSDEVKGKITLKLREVPWDQALVMVMRTKGLGYIRQGSVLRITKLEALQAEAKTAKEIVDAQAKLTPLKVKVIPISYASPKEIVTQVTPFLSDGRGKVVSDERTSALIITDTAETLERVERLIKELDIPPAQVMIEGKIVEATESFSRNLGINWNFGDTVNISDSGGKEGGAVDLGVRGASKTFTSSSVGLLGITFGQIDILGNLNAELGLAETEQLARIISSPRIVTMNRVEAEISQKGQVVSFKSQAVSNQGESSLVASEPVFRDVVLSLKVTPQITAEGSVIMDMEVKREFPGASINGASAINTRQAKTKVLVANGQTAVIGGIYQSDESNNESGVPVLKDVPVFGWLFKGKESTRTKNELLVFLTPRILNAKEQGVVE